MRVKDCLTMLTAAALVLTGCGKKQDGGQAADAVPAEQTAEAEKAGPPPEITTFTDERDGKTYKAVVIGGQKWMAENLNFKTDGSKCYGDDESICRKYGRLYSWDEATTTCPAGWHLPTEEEWDRLAASVGGVPSAEGDEGNEHYNWDGAGRKLKSKSGWKNSTYGDDGNGTDEYGFSALPSGCRFANEFAAVGSGGYWWSATKEDSTGYTWRRSMVSEGEWMDRTAYDFSGDLFSVRCLADN